MVLLEDDDLVARRRVPVTLDVAHVRFVAALALLALFVARDLVPAARTRRVHLLAAPAAPALLALRRAAAVAVMLASLLAAALDRLAVPEDAALARLARRALLADAFEVVLVLDFVALLPDVLPALARLV